MLSSARIGFGGYMTWSMKVGERLHLSSASSGSVAPEQVREPDLELLERRALAEGAAVGLRVRRAVALAVCDRRASASGRGWPCRAGSGSPSGPSSGGSRHPDSGKKAPGTMSGGVVVTSPSGLPRSHARLSMSPNTWQLRAGRVAVAGRERGVVEEPPPGHHARRLGVVHRQVRDLLPACRC